MAIVPTPLSPAGPAPPSPEGGRGSGGGGGGRSGNRTAAATTTTTTMGVGAFVDVAFSSFERAFPSATAAEARRLEEAEGDDDFVNDDAREEEYRPRPSISPHVVLVTMSIPLIFLLCVRFASLGDAETGGAGGYLASAPGLLQSLIVGHALRLVLAYLIIKPDDGDDDEHREDDDERSKNHGNDTNGNDNGTRSSRFWGPLRFCRWLVRLYDWTSDRVRRSACYQRCHGCWSEWYQRCCGRCASACCWLLYGESSTHDSGDNSRSSSRGNKKHERGAPAALTGLAAVTALMFLVHPDGFTWIALGKLWDGACFILRAPGLCVALVRELDGSTTNDNTTAAALTLAAAASLACAVVLLASLLRELTSAYYRSSSSAAGGGGGAPASASATSSRYPGGAKSHRGKKGRKGRGRQQQQHGGGGGSSSSSGTKRGKGRIRDDGADAGAGAEARQQSRSTAELPLAREDRATQSSRARSRSPSPDGMLESTATTAAVGDDGDVDLEGALPADDGKQRQATSDGEAPRSKGDGGGEPRSSSARTKSTEDATVHDTGSAAKGGKDAGDGTKEATTAAAASGGGSTRSGRRRRRGGRNKGQKQAAQPGGVNAAAGPPSSARGTTAEALADAAAPPPQPTSSSSSAAIAQPESAYLPGFGRPSSSSLGSESTAPFESSPAVRPIGPTRGLPQSRPDGQNSVDVTTARGGSVNGMPLYSRLPSGGGGGTDGPAPIGGKRVYYMPNPTTAAAAASATSTTGNAAGVWYTVPNYAGSYTYSRGGGLAGDTRYTPGKIELAALLAQVGLVGTDCAALLADVPDVDALARLTDEEFGSRRYGVGPERRGRIRLMLDARRRRLEGERRAAQSARQQVQQQVQQQEKIPLPQPTPQPKPHQVAIRPPPGLGQRPNGLGIVDSSPATASLGSQEQHELPFLSAPTTLSPEPAPGYLLHEAFSNSNSHATTDLRNRCYSAGEGSVFSGTSANDNAAAANNKPSTPTLSPLPRSFLDTETTATDEDVAGEEDRIEADLQELGGQMAGMLFD